ncbi:ion channel [Octadecabacter arcticus]|uniref:ion channel n=1 Tax=Octadecabacter arcticus TaxID=53946 RepID=UPI003B83732D
MVSKLPSKGSTNLGAPQVGYGDVVLEPGWRLLAGMTSTHGLLIFGIFIAFLVEVYSCA